MLAPDPRSGVAKVSESQKLEALVFRHDSGLLWVQSQAQLALKDLSSLLKPCSCLALASREDHKVIGVAHHAVSCFLHLHVERVQVDVGEQRRNRAALRRSDLRGFAFRAVREAYPCLEDPSYQPQYASIRDLFIDGREKYLVVHVVEEALDVRVDDPRIACVHRCIHHVSGRLAAESRSEPMASRTELLLEDGLQHLEQRLLHDPISYGWDTQRSLTSAALWDEDALHRLGAVSLGLQVLGQLL